MPFAPTSSLRSKKKLFLIIKEESYDIFPLPACFSGEFISSCQDLQQYLSSQVAVGSGWWAGHTSLGSVFLLLSCFAYLCSLQLASGARAHTPTPSLSLWPCKVGVLHQDGAGLPSGSLKAVVQLPLLFAFLLLTVECLGLPDRAPSIMHRCSVIGAPFDVNSAKFTAIVSDRNYTQPFHRGHFRIILFFMCILKYGSKFWATLPELELIISFQQWTNALCLGSKAVIFFFFSAVGILSGASTSCGF